MTSVRIEQKKKAVAFRQQGYSFNEIARELGIAKSTVSLWVRDIQLTVRQKKRLSEKGRTLEAIEKRRITRLRNERAKRLPIFQAASDSIKKVSARDLFFLGIALYWGEGSKTSRGSLNFANGDPQLVQIMVRFFKEVCSVPREKLRGHILLHHHLDAERAERYWTRISGVPLTQFYKTSMQHNKKSKNMRDSLPMGTFMLSVHDTKLFLRVMGWMDGTYKQLISSRKQLSPKFQTVL